MQAFQGTIVVLGTKYDGDVRVGYLELGLLGVWGEWHNYNNETYEANAATRGEVR